MSQYSKISSLLFMLVVSWTLFIHSAPAQARLGPCTSASAGRYFVDSIRIPQCTAILYVGYAHDEAEVPASVLLLATEDTCIVMPDVISCDECIGRSTKGSTYRGAVVKGTTVILKQHTFDYDAEIHISVARRIPVYEKIVVRSLNAVPGKRCVRTFIPRRTLHLTGFGFMRHDLDEKSLGKHFTVIRRNCDS